MPRPLTVTDSVVVNADAAALYDEISDVTRMGTWSPENRGAVVLEPRGAAYVGMQFDGSNKRGRARWTTRCTVTKAEPGELFEFRVHRIGFRTPRIRGAIATWRYAFEPAEGGTRVTETWIDGRKGWPDPVAKVFDKIVTGTTFAEFQKRNIRKTLSNLQKAFD